MTTYQIVCKTLSVDGSRIEKVGLKEEGSTSQAEVVPASNVNELIKQGHKCFFVDEGGNRVDVHDYDGKFIRTGPDTSKVNNLRHLQNC